eukprot:jgi/Chlat1/1658/Chrsp127S01950
MPTSSCQTTATTTTMLTATAAAVSAPRRRSPPSSRALYPVVLPLGASPSLRPAPPARKQHRRRARCRAQAETAATNCATDAAASASVISRTRLLRLAAIYAAAATTAAASPSLSAAHAAEQKKKKAPVIEEPDIKVITRPSGVKFQEVLEGRGDDADVARTGDTATFHYVLRRSNGYFVYSTVQEDAPFIARIGTGQLIPGLSDVLQGMKPGGKRRALVPPSQGYMGLNGEVDPNLQPMPVGFGPKRSLYAHASEPLVFEIQLLKLKHSS